MLVRSRTNAGILDAASFSLRRAFLSADLSPPEVALSGAAIHLGADDDVDDFGATAAKDLEPLAPRAGLDPGGTRH